MRIDFEKLLEEKAETFDRVIEKYIPRKYNEQSLIFSLNPPRYDHNLDALNKAISDPIWNFLDRGGKRWRPFMFLLIIEALDRNPDEFLDFAIIPEIVHNGTIMIDDIEDNSEFRRGKPCAHRLLGSDVAINAGNAMYYLPLLTLIKNKHKISCKKLIDIYEIYVREMIDLSLGQAIDIAWHNDLVDAEKIAEKQYLQMCAYKTGTLARMAAKIAAILCEASEDAVERFGRFAEAIGVAFQIQDDVLDLTSKDFFEKKGGAGQDITEGKRSLMVIHTLEKAEPLDKRRLIEILKMHTNDQELKDEAIRIMNRYNSIEYAKEFARNIVNSSWKEIDVLLRESEAKEKIRAFAIYLVERTI